jgi:5'-phosphate synthase pdxT subunit
VERLAEHDGEVVLAQEGTILVAAFHPELTQDSTVHRYFCGLVESTRRSL